MRNKSSGDKALARGAHGVGATVGAVLPASRSQEREADDLGLIYSAKGRLRSKSIHTILAKNEKQKPSENATISFQPIPIQEKEFEYLQSRMPYAMTLYRSASKIEKKFPNHD